MVILLSIFKNLLFFQLWKTFSFNRYCDCCVTKRKSASTVEAVKMIQKQGLPVVAITNDVQSPLALEAAQIIDLGAGVESVGFVTKGYSATVLQLLLLGIGIGISKNKISKKIEQDYMQQLRKIINHLPAIIQKRKNFLMDIKVYFV